MPEGPGHGGPAHEQADLQRQCRRKNRGTRPETGQRTLPDRLCSRAAMFDSLSQREQRGLLLLLLDVQRVLAKLGRVLLHTQFFATGLPPQRVVGVSGLFADEVHHFEFLFAFGHLNEPSSRSLNVAKARRAESDRSYPSFGASPPAGKS